MNPCVNVGNSRTRHHRLSVSSALTGGVSGYRVFAGGEGVRESPPAAAIHGERGEAQEASQFASMARRQSSRLQDVLNGREKLPTFVRC